TTSGFFNDPALKCTIEVMGTDRMYFSADYPFERMEDAARWYDETPTIADSDRLKIGRTNAIRLFDLDLE
ncbi:MAG: amidohydrolase family protein, partial [Rhodospirillaceae bacterium]|nr:amidohydrolase family protein [Rhodospirillaceae bacterium]